eukprot:gene558-599_t
MTNVIFVAAGQCGNQLGLELLNYLNLHAIDKRYFALHNGGASVEEECRDRLVETFFRTHPATDDGTGYASDHSLIARTVCLDTEPKVIDDCLRHVAQHKSTWSYDNDSIAFRHGGAGNNWALGYAMASGEFLDTSLNCIRKQVEKSDGSSLVFLHSLAGGTGSGLGTHITEACQDEFPDLLRFNIAIAPHHFGEVVVQYYNALLCLAKISSASHGVMVFENEVAQMLCKEMRGIEKPKLADLNNAISSNLLSLFLPKISSPARGCFGPKLVGIDRELTHLCSHPSYRFVNIKLTPQTSKKSIDFTFDSWPGLLKTIQRLQLSGTSSERHISRELRNAGSIEASPSKSPGASASLIRSLGSAITCYGDSSHQAVRELNDHLEVSTTSRQLSTPPRHHDKRSPKKGSNGPGPGIVDSPWLTDFLSSHSNLLALSGENPVAAYHSPFALNRYQRSCSLLANDQSILPVLQRPWQRSRELFEMRAYLHQYSQHGIDDEDFLAAFRSISGVVHNYATL